MQAVQAAAAAYRSVADDQRRRPIADCVDDVTVRILNSSSSSSSIQGPAL